MKKLHTKQKILLELLKKNIDDPLTVRELQQELGVSSTSVVHHHIRQLEKKGYLRRNPSNPSDYQVLGDSPDRKITYLNLYGLAFCGPEGSVLDGDPIERIPLSSKLLGFSSSEAFMVKAKGDSMEPKINDGDLLIVRKSPSADNGDIIVCVNKGEALVKKFQKNNSGVILVSLNQNYAPFVVSEDFRVEGIVRGFYSYNVS